MPYVAKDDLILFIENEENFLQGNPQAYIISLYKDYLDNGLDMDQPTSIHVALFVDDNRVIQYSNPSTPGVSGNLLLDVDNSTASWTIDLMQSTYLPDGDLFAEVSVVYENFYPQPKTYVFPRLKLGQVIDNPNIDNGGDNGNGGNNGNGGETPAIVVTHNGTFTVEATNGTEPTAPGMVTLDSETPGDVTEILFRNLDSNQIRLTSLENFLSKRITNDEINGVITIIDTDPTNMYSIYKIEGWQRVDLTPGNGDYDDSDGIKIQVSLEASSTGPGVTQTIWQVGQKITYELDAHGITGQELLPNGILTYVDKNVNPEATSGDSAPTGITMSYSPYQDSYVTVEVNGISVEIGDGLKDKDAYFSGDNGVTATTIEEIRLGDELFWNGNIAGFDLETGDEINLIYEAKAEDLR